MISKSEIYKLFFIFLGWRVFLFFIASVSPLFLSYQPSFPYSVQLSQLTSFPSWIYSWGNFDGVHYLTIIEKGYLGTGLIQAFFPLYPLIAKVINLVFQNEFISALILSNVSAFIMLILFYILLKLENPKIKWLGVFLLVLFPTSFYFLAIYNESLFLSFILASFIFIKKKKWLLASLMAGLASATRLVGIFMIFSLLFEFWQSLPKKSKKTLGDFVHKYFLALFIFSLASIGLFSYMLYLWIVFKDPLYFFHVQSEFGAGRQTNLIFLPQVVWRYIKILLTARPINLKYFSYFQEFFLSLISLIILFFSYKKIRTSYLFFSVGAFILPTLTGTFSSMPRYVIVLFPIYMWLSLYLVNKPILKILFMTISLFLLILNTVLFIQGRWVA